MGVLANAQLWGAEWRVSVVISGVKGKKEVRGTERKKERETDTGETEKDTETEGKM